MKGINNYIRRATLLLIIALLASTVGFSQESGSGELVTKNTNTRHYLGGWLYGGYSALFHGIDQSKVLGGGGVGIGGGYQLRVKRFLLNTGVEFQFLNSYTKVMGISGEKVLLYPASIKPDGVTGDYIKLRYNYLKYRDIQNVGIVNVPILAGMRFTATYDFYFLAGVKVGLPVMGFGSSKGKVNTAGFHEEYIDTFIGMPNHFYGDQIIKKQSHKTPSKFGGLNVAASAEFGMEISKWVFKPKSDKEKEKIERERAKAQRQRQKKGKRGYQPFEREMPTLRVALFADYGFMNINQTPQASPATDMPSEPVGFDLDPNVVVFENENLLATNRGYKKTVTPFIVGVKGTLLFDVTKPKLLPLPEPIPPIPPKPPVQLITGKVIDVVTGAEINGVKVTMTDTLGKVLYTEELKDYGVFNTKLRRDDTYKVTVKVPNYYEYSELASNVGDTLMVYLQPVQKSSKIIIQNIYFEFDSHKLTPESNAELDNQAKILRDNPEINILITGHTDSKGSDDYNMRLSDRRANSVREALIERGVAPERLKAEGRGETQPLNPDDTEAAENRRIEFEIL